MLDIVLLVAVLLLATALTVVKVRSDRARAQLESDKNRLTIENQSLAVYRPVRDISAEVERVREEGHQRLSSEIRQAEERRAGMEQQAAMLLKRAELTAQVLASESATEAAKVRAEANQFSKEVRERAEADTARVRAEAIRLLKEGSERAEAEADRGRVEASQLLKDAREKSDSVMRSANVEAKAVVDHATKRAQEIAGSAFEVVQNAERFERIAHAMKNLIEGYGDRYLIPSHSLLDDLAEEYGFAEAGIELKNARERTRAMVKNGTAATCDYVEAHRRETAIRFVVDAFNGKVDSTLSRVKADNLGTLAQEIRDAFALVNHDGSAFRNARVVDTYLEARLTELRWAVTVQELKLRDREEQRRIRDQMREEAKVQREIERALRESAKEEEMLRRAMEKVQEQMLKASEAQRQQYEAKLAEMAEKMRKLEEDRQRAKSMAEQTRTGHVYVISNVGSFGENVYKIGLTRRLEPSERVHELGGASVPFSFDIHAMIHSSDAPALERQLHKAFLTTAVNKGNLRKEFFRVSLSSIRDQVDKLGLAAKWTMTADAREYRETLALERTFAEKPEAAREWSRLHSDFDNLLPNDLLEEDVESETA
jgi:hypothetical protein